MIINRLGYACINDTLANQTPKISTSRTLRKETYEKEGLNNVGNLILANLNDLLHILQWNENRGIKLFRMSSDILPWRQLWQWEDLEVKKEVFNILEEIGRFAKKHNHRLTFHPGHFIKLCSPNPKLVNTSITELEHINELLNIMGFTPSYFNTVNIHVGAAYKDKEETLRTFNSNFLKLSDTLQKRLTIENDDKRALYTTSELYSGVFKHTEIPIMFDFHHYQCNPDADLSECEAAELSISTWPEKYIPLFHWSESRNDEYIDRKYNAAAHSDICYGPLPAYQLSKPIDLMIEAKKKEKSFPFLKYANGELVHKFSNF